MHTFHPTPARSTVGALSHAKIINSLTSINLIPTTLPNNLILILYDHQVLKQSANDFNGFDRQKPSTRRRSVKTTTAMLGLAKGE